MDGTATRRHRSSTTVEAPSSWGPSSFLKRSVPPPSSSSPSPPSPSSPSSSPSSSSSSMGAPHPTLSPLMGSSRTGSFSAETMRHPPHPSPSTAPPHRRSPSHIPPSVDVPRSPSPSPGSKSFLTSSGSTIGPPNTGNSSPTGSMKAFLTSPGPPSPGTNLSIPVPITASNSASTPLLVSSPRHSLPPSAFANTALAMPQLNNVKTTSKTRAFAQTVVDFLRSPRGSISKPTPPVIAPNPYANQQTNMNTAVFGVELDLAVQRSNHIHPYLPDVIYKCILYLHSKGVVEEGIFRLTGSVNDIKKMKDKFDEGSDYDIAGVLNPHTVAGLLKLFIRDMPQQLFPISWAWSESRPVQELHDLIASLPPPNRCFLSCLIRLLCRISEEVAVTKMGVPNLVIVFSAALQCTGSFITHLISHSNELFPVDDLHQTRQKIEEDKKMEALREAELGAKLTFSLKSSGGVVTESEIVIQRTGNDGEGDKSEEGDTLIQEGKKEKSDKGEKGEKGEKCEKSKKSKKKEKERGATKKGKRKTDKEKGIEEGDDRKKDQKNEKERLKGSKGDTEQALLVANRIDNEKEEEEKKDLKGSKGVKQDRKEEKEPDLFVPDEPVDTAKPQTKEEEGERQWLRSSESEAKIRKREKSVEEIVVLAEERKAASSKKEEKEEKGEKDYDDIFKEDGREVSYLNLLPVGQKDTLGAVASKYTKGPDRRKVKKRIQTIFDSDDDDDHEDENKELIV